ncbi:MAG: hypothetical protein AVDCRST_MAG30-151, partial [uncultured Solirubrobacteraceae bacterium]
GSAGPSPRASRRGSPARRSTWTCRSSSPAS